MRNSQNIRQKVNKIEAINQCYLISGNKSDYFVLKKLANILWL